MTRTRTISTLTPDRLTNLRLLAAGATRRKGMPWRCTRSQLEWFAREGYIVLGDPPPPNPGKPYAPRSITWTAKGLAAIESSVPTERKIREELDRAAPGSQALLNKMRKDGWR